jgi:alpha-tubulin suppressor-like RCC1 family protein
MKLKLRPRASLLVALLGCGAPAAPGTKLAATASSPTAAVVTVPELAPGALRLAVGDEHVCQLLDDGAVRCSGDNRLDQLGNGFSPFQLEPAEVPGLSEVTDVAMFDALTCALDARGKVFCFGDRVPVPTELPLPKVVAMMAGQGKLLVQLADGRFGRVQRYKLFEQGQRIDLAGGPSFRDARLAADANVYLRSRSSSACSSMTRPQTRQRCERSRRLSRTHGFSTKKRGAEPSRG